MNEATLFAILGISGTLLSGILSHVLTKRSERNRQVLLIRAELIKPIEEWVNGAEKVLQIVGDRIAAISFNSPITFTYSFEEKRLTAQFMGETRNRILGILNSNSLTTRSNRKLVRDLREKVVMLDNSVTDVLLPLDKDLFEQFSSGTLTQEIFVRFLEIKPTVDVLIQEIHSLIARLKTSYV